VTFFCNGSQGARTHAGYNYEESVLRSGNDLRTVGLDGYPLAPAKAAGHRGFALRLREITRGGNAMPRLRTLFAGLILALIALGLPAMPASAAPVIKAELTIISGASTDSSAFVSGHAFLAVKNLSADPITVGRVSNVAPGETITIGTWGNKDEHDGVWYNLEAYYAQKDPHKYDSSLSLTRGINGAQLSTLNDYVRNHDSYEPYWGNCSSFATGAWDAVMPWDWEVWASIKPGWDSPATAKYFISLNGAHKQGFTIPWSGRGVFYGNGSKIPTASKAFVIAGAPSITGDVIGSGVSVQSQSASGTPDQWGHVDGLVTGSQAWVLSTGRAGDAVGIPSTFASTDLGGPGNDALTALAGAPTHDAASYKVTLTPGASHLHVRYVFASEEYPEYVGSQYNDVMAVFVNGTNCALVPGTDQPVAINTINATTNSAWYVDNTTGASGYGTTYDGLTKPLQCDVSVTPGSPVTIEIAIADTSDGIYDSGVAILDKGIWAD
jgi:hypothetical protein